VSAVSYNNIYYILRQSHTSVEIVSLLDELSELTEITDVTKSIIKNRLSQNLKILKTRFNTTVHLVLIRLILSLPAMQKISKKVC
jgi:hypothetical protein